jgi:hypothetical protein
MNHNSVRSEAQKKWGGKSRPENLPCQAVGDYSVTQEGEPRGSASRRGKFGTAIIDEARSRSPPLAVAFRHTVVLPLPGTASMTWQRSAIDRLPISV